VKAVLAPTSSVVFEGRTEIDSSATAVMFAVAVAESPPSVAVIVDDPTATAVTSPVAETVANDVADEVHASDAPPSTCVLPSLNVPVATNCCDAPVGIFFVAGVTARPVRLAAVTVNVAVPVTGPGADWLDTALTVAVPTPTAVTAPVVETLTTVPSLVPQVAVRVRFLVAALSNVPVALSVSEAPSGSVVDAGVTATERSVPRTVTVLVAERVPSVAVMVTLPRATAVTFPSGLTVAIVASLVVQVHDVVSVSFV
jgi:hypothetical protein